MKRFGLYKCGLIGCGCFVGEMPDKGEYIRFDDVVDEDEEEAVLNRELEKRQLKALFDEQKKLRKELEACQAKIVGLNIDRDQLLKKAQSLRQNAYAYQFALGLPIPDERSAFLSDGTQPRNVRMEELHKQVCQVENEASSLRYALTQAREESLRLCARKEELERDLAAFRQVLGDATNLSERVARLEAAAIHAENLREP